LVKKSTHPDTDDPLFRREMLDVVPLKTSPTTDSRPPRKPVPEHRPDSASPMPGEVFSGPSKPAMGSTAADGSSHRGNGVQNRTLQKLKRGRYRIAAQLDLHSMTTESARTALLDFIAGAHARSQEAVRVIHGKGLRSENGPRLKQMTHQVLRDHSLVRAFTSCKPSAGGSGAVDVLLKTS
jgi:DNA-nicking Smr family endonuclease